MSLRVQQSAVNQAFEVLVARREGVSKAGPEVGNGSRRALLPAKSSEKLFPAPPSRSKSKDALAVFPVPGPTLQGHIGCALRSQRSQVSAIKVQAILRGKLTRLWFHAELAARRALEMEARRAAEEQERKLAAQQAEEAARTARALQRVTEAKLAEEQARSQKLAKRREDSRRRIEETLRSEARSDDAALREEWNAMQARTEQAEREALAREEEKARAEAAAAEAAAAEAAAAEAAAAEAAAAEAAAAEAAAAEAAASAAEAAAAEAAAAEAAAAEAAAAEAAAAEAAAAEAAAAEAAERASHEASCRAVEERAATRISAGVRGRRARKDASHVAAVRRAHAVGRRRDAAAVIAAAGRRMAARRAARRAAWERELTLVVLHAASTVCCAARRWRRGHLRRKRRRAAELIARAWRRALAARAEESAAARAAEEAARAAAARAAAEAAAEARRRQDEVERWKAEAAELLRREQEARRLGQLHAEQAARAAAEEAARAEQLRQARVDALARRREHKAQRKIQQCWRAFVFARKKGPAAVQIQANYRGWIERERGASLVTGKSHFDFPRRLEDMSLPFQPGSLTLSAKARADLNFVVTTLKAMKQLKVRVVGTCKHTEPPLIARRRSVAITEYLLQHGVLKRQLRPEASLPPSVGGIRSYGSSDVHFRVIQSLILPRPIVFESCSVAIKPRSEEMLQKVVMAIEAHPAIDLLVEGHADSQEAAQADSLASKRAEVVKKWLYSHGARCTMETASFGATCPIASNLTYQGRRQNRRAELQIRLRE